MPLHNIKKFPAISIIMPTFNSDIYLGKTLKSVVNQSFKNWELIIIDDNSTDNSSIIIKRFKDLRFKYFKNRKNLGPALSRNEGIKKAKGEFIAFLDSDDFWSPSKLKNQLNFMIKNKFNFTCTSYIPFKDKKNKKFSIIHPRREFDFSEFILDTNIATSSMIIKKKLIKKIKFVKGYRFDDYIFKCKILKKEKCFTLQYPLLKYRVRKKSISSNPFKNAIDVWKINKEILKLDFLNNLKSIFSISLNSIKKYGIKTIF